MMDEKDVLLLEFDGWTIECESPFEIRHQDGSFATGQAANIVLQYIKDEFTLVNYNELALGTRFSYLFNNDTIWVKLSDDDCGLIARFDPDYNYRECQLIQPAASSIEDLKNLQVLLREG